jgi:hypothetical protein
MPLNNLLDNKFEFAYQTKQPISDINSLPYWELEAYIERLNEKNKEAEAKQKAAEKEQAKNQQMNNKSFNLSKFKRPKTPKF